MIKFENTEVLGWTHAIRGCRNPMNSWDRSDSGYIKECSTCKYYDEDDEVCRGDDWSGQPINTENCYEFKIGPNDLDLMKRLAAGGPVHAKYRRMITVYVDITAPLYWWKEFDAYKVGTVANSCSTMHKIADKEFTLEDFSHERMIHAARIDLGHTIDALNFFRRLYLHGGMAKDEDGNLCGYEKKSKEIWWQMIQLLPSSYNQKRTVMCNYETLTNIYKSRKDHKLDEWKTFCNDWIKNLPYSDLITGEDENEKR